MEFIDELMLFLPLQACLVFSFDLLAQLQHLQVPYSTQDGWLDQEFSFDFLGKYK